KRAIANGKKGMGSSVSGAHLKKQAEAKGELADPPYEGLYDRDHAEPLEVREARYRVYLEAGAKRAKTPVQIAESRFFCAASCGLDELALEHYRAGEEHIGWDYAVKAAQFLARRSDGEAAWAVLEKKLPVWQPLSHAQVAPLVLLCDEHLAPLMTEARRKLVLATPRGL
ncbi:MAG TPA: hypothetical protein VHB21_18115, partial [Minicystis sp.]|nr:hypothetical protein [Minicystis sp.]